MSEDFILLIIKVRAIKYTVVNVFVYLRRRQLIDSRVNRTLLLSYLYKGKFNFSGNIYNKEFLIYIISIPKTLLSILKFILTDKGCQGIIF